MFFLIEKLKKLYDFLIKCIFCDQQCEKNEFFLPKNPRQIDESSCTAYINPNELSKVKFIENLHAMASGYELVDTEYVCTINRSYTFIVNGLDCSM